MKNTLENSLSVKNIHGPMTDLLNKLKGESAGVWSSELENFLAQRSTWVFPKINNNNFLYLENISKNICKLLNNLDGEDSNIWFLEFKKFLRKEPNWITGNNLLDQFIEKLNFAMIDSFEDSSFLFDMKSKELIKSIRFENSITYNLSTSICEYRSSEAKHCYWQFIPRLKESNSYLELNFCMAIVKIIQLINIGYFKDNCDTSVTIFLKERIDPIKDFFYKDEYSPYNGELSLVFYRNTRGKHFEISVSRRYLHDKARCDANGGWLCLENKK